MKKTIILLVLLLAGIALTGCSRVEPGHVGVKVYMTGGNKGVDQEVVGPGNYLLGWNTNLYDFPTFQQNYTWTKTTSEGNPTDESITFQTNDGLSINADIGIQYNITQENVGAVFQKYREGVKELTDIVLRNMVRDAFVRRSTQYTAEEAYSSKKSILMDSVVLDVKREAKSCGITVDNIYFVGSMRLPDQVIGALNAKIKAVQDAQRIENEVQSTKAEAEKAVAEAEGKSRAILIEAKAQAEANKLLAASVTPTLVEIKKVEKWNGINSQVVSGSGSGMMINVK